MHTYYTIKYSYIRSTHRSRSRSLNTHNPHIPPAGRRWHDIVARAARHQSAIAPISARHLQKSIVTHTKYCYTQKTPQRIVTALSVLLLPTYLVGWFSFLAGRPRLITTPASSNAWRSAIAIWRLLFGFTGRPRFTSPPWAMRCAWAANRCWRLLFGLIGRPVRTPGAELRRCWRLLVGSIGRPVRTLVVKLIWFSKVVVEALNENICVCFVLVCFFSFWYKDMNLFLSSKPHIDLFFLYVGRSFLSGINVRTGLCGLNPSITADKNHTCNPYNNSCWGEHHISGYSKYCDGCY